jgi:cephalosporin hydroxylase
MSPAELTGRFHDLFYSSQVWRNTYWRSVPVLKCPLDLWIYQELIFKLTPDPVVECGTWAGGSSLYIADLLDLTGRGTVLTIDILSAEEVKAHYALHLPKAVDQVQIRPEHPRVRHLLGSSTEPAIIQNVKEIASGKETVLVIADSDHSQEHAYAELHTYCHLVTPGSYFIMEDTNIPFDGPGAAVARFLDEHPEFESDLGMQKFLLTFNPGGYLRRKVD